MAVTGALLQAAMAGSHAAFDMITPGEYPV